MMITLEKLALVMAKMIGGPLPNVALAPEASALMENMSKEQIPKCLKTIKK